MSRTSAHGTDRPASAQPKPGERLLVGPVEEVELASAVEIATGVVVLSGLVGLASDPFLVPVNAVLLGDPFDLLVVPGAGRAPWLPALATQGREVGRLLCLTGAGRDLDLARNRLPGARQLVTTNRALVAAGLADRLELIAAPGGRRGATALRCRERGLVLSGDALGAVVRHRVDDVDELAPSYWHAGLRAHAAWADTDPSNARTVLASCDEVVVPSFGPVVPSHRVAEALDQLDLPRAPDRAHSCALDHLTARGPGW